MHKIFFAKSAAKELGRIYRIEKKLYFHLIAAVERLQTNPYQGKRLKGKLQGDYSLRVGNYRVIYTIHKHKLIIYIVDVGHRKEIYR